MKKPKPIELSKVTLANKAHKTLEKKESKMKGATLRAAE
jgi:hypothetical protein